MSLSVTKGGFFPRLVAYLIDILVVVMIFNFVKFPLLFIKLLVPDLFLFKDILFQYDIFDLGYYLFHVAYFTLFTAFAGTTFGKWLFKLSVVDEEGNKLKFGAALFRESVGRFLSYISIIGYLMIVVSKDKKALHDYLTDSYVIYSCKFREVRKVVPAPMPPVMPVNAGYAYGRQPQPAQPVQNVSFQAAPADEQN